MSEERLNRQVKVRFDTPTFARIWADAEANGVTIAETVRRIVEDFYKYQSARVGAAVVADVLRDVIEPHVDRLAGMLAHAGIAAGTSAWLVRALVNLLTQVDPDEAWEQAVARAKTGLRRSLKAAEEDEGEEDQD